MMCTFRGDVIKTKIIKKSQIQNFEKRGTWTLALCLTPAVDVTNDKFLQTCIKNALLYTKTIKISGQLRHSTSPCLYQLYQFLYRHL